MPLLTRDSDAEDLRRRAREPAAQHSRLVYQDLHDDLFEFCRFVPPVTAHYDVYSTKLWGIILRACAEIDSQLHGLMVEKAGKSRRTDITDYIKNEGTFKLASCELFTLFERAPLVPFESFSAGKSPSWWKDHTAAKHRRLESLQRATLKNALDAVGGLYVVLLRQWGHHLMPRPVASNGMGGDNSHLLFGVKHISR